MLNDIFYKMVQATSTVRVAQVGLDVTDQTLEDLFSDYGPIKRCFVVKPKKTKINNKDVNRTIGYVEFAIAEDAETAINEISQKSPKASQNFNFFIDFSVF